VRADPAAAGGARIWNPNAGLAKVVAPAANPADYFELTFDAEAGRPYHLWIRGFAENDYYGNDSVHVQFSGSTDASGAAVFRIGTASATTVCVEAGNGAGLSGWGWEDNGWDSLGTDIYFASSGLQTLRVQRREDGISIDQIVLSPSTFLTTSPGAAKNDWTILPESGGTGEPPPPGDTGEQVIHASRAAIVGDAWTVVSDPGAAGGAALASLDRAVPKIATALAAPASYAELSFDAAAGKPYRIWIRGRADRNYWGNDSVHLQFSGSVTAGGEPVYRIGTTDSTVVNLEDCSGCGLRGWGWQDNGWGTGVLGPEIYFSTTGLQTVRVQVREDGYVIDQLVVSPAAYLDRPPGSLKDDTTILPETPAD
jgi:hypothetical protein